MIRLGALALLGLTPAILTAAVKVGDLPPHIQFDRLLPEQPAATASLQALTGNVIVLEMWATWCGPCVSAIPHLNEMADKFKGRPIVFLSVTNEEPAVVENFLKKRPISGVVGIAHTHNPLNLYGADSLPATFLIDTKGKIAGITDPELVSESMLEALMTGRTLPVIDLMIRPRHGPSSTVPNRFSRNGLALSTNLSSIISILWEVQAGSRMAGDPLNDPTSYDVALSTPGANPGTFISRARDVIAAAFKIHVNFETREMDVWTLAKTQARPAALEPGGATSGPASFGIFPTTPPSAGRSLEMTDSEMSVVGYFLETATQKPVVDETGITGKYNFHVSYDKADPEGCIDALRNAGFKVEPARRKIRYVNVTRAE